MKKSLFFLVSIIITSLLFLTAFSLHAQKKETEFWLVFGHNYNSPYTNVDLQIRIVSGDKPTTGTIYFTELGLEASVPFSMSADTVFTYSLTNTQKQAVYNTTMGKSSKSIRITSSEPVKVYALNQRSTSTDATNIFSVEVLSNNYYQISHHPNPGRMDAFAVVAIEDNTEIRYDGIVKETLNAGDVYYHISSIDMTGAHITANHPFAFFAVNRMSQIPAGSCGGDHLFQQLPPVNTWGKNFFVPVSNLTKDRVRIVAMKDTTTITQTDGTFIFSSSGNYTINAGQYIELEVLLDNNGCFIHADKPVGVCTYLTGCVYNDILPIISDAAQAWLPPIEQFVSKTIVTPFYPTGASNLNAHYALVVTLTATKKDTKVSIGGVLPDTLNGGTWYDHSSGYSFYTMPLANNAYRFTNSNNLIVMGYGVGLAESYYYLAGSAMRELDAAFYANDIHFQELKDTAFCVNEVVDFRAEVENMGIGMDSIKWYIDGIKENLPYSQLEWSKTFLPGNYEIKMWVRFENEDTISKADTLRIKNCEQIAVFYANNVNITFIDTTFCAKGVEFHTDIEGLNTSQDSIKWYIDLGDGSGFIEYVLVQNQKQWSKDFSTGTYLIKMWARLENGNEIEITGTLRMEVFWIKIRNVRY